MPLSDSDSLPDLDTFLTAPRTFSLRTKPSSQSTSKRKRRRPRPNSTAKASEPIELTSDDEPKPPPSKRKRTSHSADLIDLCSDDHEVTPRPPRSNRKSRARAPREEEIIVLVSSDNEEFPASCAKPSSSKTMNNNRQRLSPAASTPPIKTSRPEENNLAPSTDNGDELLELLAPSPGLPPATSPVAGGSEAEFPTDGPAKVRRDLPDEDGRAFGPLQHIYNEAFQNASPSDAVEISSPAFSWKTRTKSIRTCEPSHPPSSHPPLLTPSFFRRVQEALSVPQNQKTSARNDLAEGYPPNQSSTAPVKSDLVPSSLSSAIAEIGESPTLPLTELDRPLPEKSQPECVTAVEEITEDAPPEISPAVAADAVHTASPSSPEKEPTSSKSPQSTTTEQSGACSVLNTRSTIGAVHKTPPHLLSPESITTEKIAPTGPPQINACGPLEADLQEIEAMLLPGHDLSDEELLAMGLCYPEY